MAKLSGFAPRLAGAAAFLATAVTAASLPLKPVIAGNDYWRHGD